ncbi:MAG: hypothetical protein JMM75_02620 [Candidatus Xiphinematobacter sp.]|nr:MAG: hypothetical protein JMM75_02620 [Candidatus Xiphinematobacter sp.]
MDAHGDTHSRCTIAVCLLARATVKGDKQDLSPDYLLLYILSPCIIENSGIVPKFCNPLNALLLHLPY